MTQPVGKVRPFYVLHQLLERDFRIIDLRADSVDHFGEIVRRNIGRHAHGDAGPAINEQIWKGSRENRRLGACFVIIWDEIDRVLVHVGHQRGAEMRHTRFGVTHRRGRIAFDRAEVTLAVDERFTHRPRLRHVDERRINHRFAVRMIISAGVTANLRAFAMLSPGKEREIMHRVKNSALRWFESVARVRQRARNNDRHRVIEEGPRYFLGYIYRFNFLVWVKHDVWIYPCAGKYAEGRSVRKRSSQIREISSACLIVTGGPIRASRGSEIFKKSSTPRRVAS